jgi:hypothetical protein
MQVKVQVVTITDDCQEVTRKVAWYRGSRRYQRKIYGKEDSGEITVGRRARIHPQKTRRCAGCDFIR